MAKFIIGINNFIKTVNRPGSAVSNLRSLFFHSSDTAPRCNNKLESGSSSSSSSGSRTNAKLTHSEAVSSLPVIPEPLSADNVSITITN